MNNKTLITVDRDDLFAAVRAAERALPRKPHPVLSNFLLEIKAGELWVTATNLDSAIRAAVDAIGDGEHRICVSGQTLMRTIATLEDSQLSLRISGKEMFIVRDAGDIKIRTSDANNFPNAVLSSPDNYRFKFERLDLLEALKLSGFILENDLNIIDAFKGSAKFTVFTNLIESKFEIQSTNGHALSLVRGLCEKQTDAEDGFFSVPRTALIQIAAILGVSAGDDVYLSDDANHLFLNIDRVAYSFRKTAIQFPDMSAATTAEFPMAFTLNSREARQALKRLEIFCDEKKRRAELHVTDDRVTFASSSADRGEVEESFDIKLIGGEPFDAAFNIGYLADVFARTDEEMQLRFAWAVTGYALKAQQTGDRVRADFFIQGLQNTEAAKMAA